MMIESVNKISKNKIIFNQLDEIQNFIFDENVTESEKDDLIVELYRLKKEFNMEGPVSQENG